MQRQSRRLLGSAFAVLPAAMIAVLAVAPAQAMAATPATPGPPADLQLAAPNPAPAGSSQLITVRTPTPGAATGTLTAWQQGADGVWQIVFGPMTAQVGGNGVGAATEGSSTTPAGTHPLDQSFGRRPNPGTAMPYFAADDQDWWDENPASPTYNQHVRQPDSPGADSENLFDSGSVYDYAVNISYNPRGVPGAGSAFFLHVSQGSPTAGCVAISEPSLVSILRWLQPARRPVISIAVGPAWAPDPPAPTGRVDAVTVDALRMITVIGWAADPADPDVSANVQVTATGPRGDRRSTSSTTGLARPDLRTASPWAGPASGYLVRFPADGVGRQHICVTVLAVSRTIAPVQLGCRAVVVNFWTGWWVV